MNPQFLKATIALPNGNPVQSIIPITSIIRLYELNDVFNIELINGKKINAIQVELTHGLI